jgi:pyrroline-5-carboxylate reductase
MGLQIDGPVLFAGAGKMGGALLAGLLERGLDPRQVYVQDPSPPAEIAALLDKYEIAYRDVVAALPMAPAVLIVAVKPQVVDTVFPPLAKLAGRETLVISIAAGRTIASFEKYLAPGVAVVRAMPNTPASIGRGITGCIANSSTTTNQKALCEALLSAVGEVGWVKDEALIDVVTAVSGSGPAYVFLLAEYLAAAGEKAGLEPGLAARLARETVSGAGEMLHQTGTAADELRRNVTSPGGTTAAALEVLMGENGLRELMQRAVDAAVKRGRELGK